MVKHNALRKAVSVLLVVVMVMGLLPVTTLPVLGATTYTKLGNISEVTATADIISPAIGRKTKIPYFTVTNAEGKGVEIVNINWQKLNESDEWESYYPDTDPVFVAGTYRLNVQLRSDKNGANQYYALKSDASLSVNGVAWTVSQPLVDMYDYGGYGWIYFASPEYIVSEHVAGLKPLDSIVVTTEPDKLIYRGGEDFEPLGMEVTAIYSDGSAAIITDYTITDGLDMSEGKTSVTISYVEGGVKKTTTQPITVAESIDGEMVIEVNSWSEFTNAFSYSNYQREKYTIKLMKDLDYSAADAKRSATTLIDVHVRGCFVTLDFNGHTLSCTDRVSSSDLQSSLSDFIRITMHPIYSARPSELRLTDSVGGGGIYMNSHRAYDNQLAALHVVDACDYWIDGAYQTCSRYNRLIIDGGNYTLEAQTEKTGVGTNDRNTYYRGTVIADVMGYVEINGGTFTAISHGIVNYGDDMCARELSAFATCGNATANPGGAEYGRTVINGGTFISDGYAVHHFDHSYSVYETRYMSFPMINGGVFAGSVGYVGMSFTYENYDTSGYGMEEYREKPASQIINSESYVRCIKNGKFYELDELTVGDLHESTSLYVLSDSLFGLKTLPGTGDVTDLHRNTEQTDLFKVIYQVPYGFTASQISPYISVVPNGAAVITENVAEKTINYADYKDGLTVKLGITTTVAGEEVAFERAYTINVSELPMSAEIVSQPVSCSVEPGKYAEATVVADYAKAYQWYCMFEGTPLALTDSIVNMLGLEIEGYTSATLRLSLDGIGKEQFYCEVTGMDDTKVKTNRIYFTYGDKPSLIGLSGGEYYEGSEAKFNMWADYAERITWYVMEKYSGNVNIYTLDEFAELTGCEYQTLHKGIGSKLYTASVIFKNADANWANKYKVGYMLENSLGKVPFDPEETVPFTLVEKKPEVTKLIETQSCTRGGNMTFTFTAKDMIDAEWIFEKADEEGIMVAYSLDDMKALFPNVWFNTSITDETATLSVSNVQSELCEYVIYANAVGESASASAGTAAFNVISGMGATVSGTITSFESDTDGITIELFAEGSGTADYTVTVKGNTAEYSIGDVESGTYTMKVSKKGHATKECSVVADGDDVALDVTLWLYGDGNHDGLVDVKDAVLIKKHLASMTVEMDEDVMDVNADSVVDIKDAVKLMKKLAGMDVELGEA